MHTDQTNTRQGFIPVCLPFSRGLLRPLRCPPSPQRCSGAPVRVAAGQDRAGKLLRPRLRRIRRRCERQLLEPISNLGSTRRRGLHASAAMTGTSTRSCCPAESARAISMSRSCRIPHPARSTHHRRVRHQQVYAIHFDGDLSVNLHSPVLLKATHRNRCFGDRIGRQRGDGMVRGQRLANPFDPTTLIPFTYTVRSTPPSPPPRPTCRAISSPY